VAGFNLLIKHGGPIENISYTDKSLRNTGAHTVSANKKLMLHNMAANYNVASNDYWILRASHAIVGNNLNAQQYHSIRIYDRLLTEAEMRHNQEVDRRRFKLTFPEPTMTLEYEYGDDYPEPSGMGQDC